MRIVFFYFIALSTLSYGQNEDNLQYYTPSILLNQGQWSGQIFNNLYTQTKQFSRNGEKISTGRGRESYFTMINRFNYGISSRINIGLELWYKAVNIEDEGQNWSALTGFGPSIKVRPFKMSEITLESTLLFPTTEDLEGSESNRAFLEHDRTLWITKFLYDKKLSDDWQLFIQVSFWYSFVRESFRVTNYLQTPLTGFVSYFPNSKWTIYMMTEFWPTHYNTNDQSSEFSHAYFVQSGLGTKYQLIPGSMEIELLYTNFWYGSEAEGAGETFNLGFRLIR